MMDWSPFAAVLFDLDGVITPTADVHRRAWTDMFNGFLAGLDDQRPFTDDDYVEFVDGKPRADGVRSFLKSRSIDLPDGDADDAATAQTVAGLGTRKNDRFNEILQRDAWMPTPARSHCWMRCSPPVCGWQSSAPPATHAPSFQQPGCSIDSR